MCCCPRSFAGKLATSGPRCFTLAKLSFLRLPCMYHTVTRVDIRCKSRHNLVTHARVLCRSVLYRLRPFSRQQSAPTLVLCTVAGAPKASSSGSGFKCTVSSGGQCLGSNCDLARALTAWGSRTGQQRHIPLRWLRPFMHLHAISTTSHVRVANSSPVSAQRKNSSCTDGREG